MFLVVVERCQLKVWIHRGGHAQLLIAKHVTELVVNHLDVYVLQNVGYGSGEWCLLDRFF